MWSAHINLSKLESMLKEKSHIQTLEDESIYILREVAAQFQKPVLLFSGGKDSITMAHLAKKSLLSR